MATQSIYRWHSGSVPRATSVELELKWFAVYTSAHREKKTAAEMKRRGIENFLPLYRSVRRWSDRRVELDLPLFPGYVFVRLALKDRLNVLQVPGVARLVAFGGLPVALPEEEIAVLRTGLDGLLSATPHPYLRIGRKVRIVRGPLCGAKGILIRKKSIYRVVLSLDLIMRSVAVEVDTADIQPIY